MKIGDCLSNKGARLQTAKETQPNPKLGWSPKDIEFFTEYGEANRYKILEIIGKGSYGVVCAAIDTQTGEKVAIKKITNIFEHSSDAIRILREIKLLRLLRHPDIVEIKRIMLPPSRREFKDIYVVFELMESDLHQVIKANDDLTQEHHRFFLYQMLRALKYMHTANVYHRDLKPKNILANANCKLKICDFGLARAAFTDTPTTIFWTDYVATRWYRAPELCGSFYSKLLKDYMAGNDRTSFLYPSAVGQFRRQFAYFEENVGMSGPVIPPERKHASLPRSTVTSSMTAPKLQQCLAAFDSRPIVDSVPRGGRDADATGNIFNAASRPPPRMPKGRVVGPVLPLEGSRDMKDAYDPRVMVRNTVGLSPHYAYRSNNGNQTKIHVAESDKDSSSLIKQQTTVGKMSPGLVNRNPYYNQPHGQPPNERIAIDAKFMQAQSQYGVAGAAAVAVAAHREVGVVHMGLS
ncbi:MAP kinase 20 [Artemisia annua]|uniref:MAP kinase 20 n=1 Tax=Artemisia annua TaxID=35608 RepID=A0A2U1LJY4_ARTAN|nr:MAP kinase 20 [Artemisia annua]